MTSEVGRCAKPKAKRGHRAKNDQHRWRVGEMAVFARSPELDCAVSKRAWYSHTRTRAQNMIVYQSVYADERREW